MCALLDAGQTPTCHPLATTKVDLLACVAATTLHCQRPFPLLTALPVMQEDPMLLCMTYIQAWLQHAHFEALHQ